MIAVSKKKAKDVEESIVVTIRHSEYKYISLNIKCLRNSINRIQSKKHKIGASK